MASWVTIENESKLKSTHLRDDSSLVIFKKRTFHGPFRDSYQAEEFIQNYCMDGDNVEIWDFE